MSSPDGSPIRVLHVIAWLNRGGIETWLMNMLRAADRGEVAMDFLCQGPGEGATAGEARELGATVAWMRLGLRPWRFIRRAAELMRDQYDVVHAHLGPGSGPALEAAARAGTPVRIAAFHNTRDRVGKRFYGVPGASLLFGAYTRWSIGRMARHATFTSGCSQAAVDVARSEPGLSEIPGRPALYGVPLERFRGHDRAEVRRELDLADGDFGVAHVGRFDDQKNHAGLIDAAAALIRELPVAGFVLIGDGPLRPVIERAVAARGLAERFRFLGIRSDVPRLLCGCDAFCFPSLYEGFGLVLVEAAAAGLPIVASDIDGLREAVSPGGNADLFPVDRTDLMAAQLVEIARDGDLRSRMADAGRRLARERFSVAAGWGRLAELYREVLDLAGCLDCRDVGGS